MDPPSFFSSVFPETFYVLWCGRRLDALPKTVRVRGEAWLVFASQEDAVYYGDNVLEWGRYKVEKVDLDEAHAIFPTPTVLVIYDRNWQSGQREDRRPTLELQPSYGHPHG